MRVAGYIRVSTDEQAQEGYSLDHQRHRLEQFCEAQGWTLVHMYQDDKSGRTTERPEYQAMLAARNQWDTLVVLKMDRIHRNSRNFMQMMEDLGRWGKNFVSATEALDTSTAMGRFVMDIMQRIAQLESEQIGERVRPAMLLAKQDNIHVGRPPVGFGLTNDARGFVITEWAKRLTADAERHGNAEAGRRNPYSDGKRVSETAVRRVRRNVKLFNNGLLTVNTTREHEDR